jgi:hypothetical protein
MLFMPCIIDSQLTVLSPTKCAVFFRDILYFSITFKTPTCFDPLWDHHQGIRTEYCELTQRDFYGRKVY